LPQLDVRSPDEELSRQQPLRFQRHSMPKEVSPYQQLDHLYMFSNFSLLKINSRLFLYDTMILTSSTSSLDRSDLRMSSFRCVKVDKKTVLVIFLDTL
jgi:hypothetical protein